MPRATQILGASGAIARRLEGFIVEMAESAVTRDSPEEVVAEAEATAAKEDIDVDAEPLVVVVPEAMQDRILLMTGSLVLLFELVETLVTDSILLPVEHSMEERNGGVCLLLLLLAVL